MQVLDIFGKGVQSYSAVVTAQRRLNCFYDLRPDGDKFNVSIVGTPGTILDLVLPTSPIRGFWVVGSLLYAVAGSILYSITSGGVATLRGIIGTTTGKVSMADNGTQIMIVDGSAGYIYTIATTTLSTIVDANFPNGAATVTFLNGRFFVEKAGTRQFYESQSYDGTLWTPLIFATKENASDVLKAVGVFNGLLILWGTTTMEFWQDVGAAPLTVTRINGGTQSWGLAAVNSRAQVNNTQYFLGNRPEGGYQIARLRGYNPEAVSTSDIDSIINGFSTVSDAVALTYTVYGHQMYQITFPTAMRSFLFDTISSIWFEVQTGVAQTARHVAELGIVFNSINYISDSSTGNIYHFSPDAYTDNGTPIKRQIRSKHINNGGNRFVISEVYLDMEVGVALQSGQGSDPQLMVQVSKDMGQTFGVERLVSLGQVGQYMTRVIMRRFGQSIDFVFQFTMTDPVKFILTRGSGTMIGGSDG